MWTLPGVPPDTGNRTFPVSDRCGYWSDTSLGPFTPSESDSSPPPSPLPSSPLSFSLTFPLPSPSLTGVWSEGTTPVSLSPSVSSWVF